MHRPLRLDPARARTIAAGFRNASLLVVGDIMLDRFLWGSVTRISPEAPVPVVRLERESLSLGGAGNVARNIVALGGRAIPVAIHGDDAEGERLRALCHSAGIGTEGLIEAPGRPTTVKTRVVAHQQHVVRVDREEDGPPASGVARRLSDCAARSLDGVAAVVVSDYDKGALSAELLGRLLPEAKRRGLPVVIDPKLRLFQHYRPATVITPNAHEAMQAAGMPARSDAEFEALGRTLLDRLGCPHLLLTRGERGMLLISSGAPPLGIPTVAREVFDVTGAGDTVAATLALALAAGATVAEGAILANQAAGVVVGKVGTASVSSEELIASLAGFPGGSV